MEAHTWDPESGPPPATAINGAEVVFNLAGEPGARGRVGICRRLLRRPRRRGLDETSSPGRGFLADGCVEREREAWAAERLGLRVVYVRTGIVLAHGAINAVEPRPVTNAELTRALGHAMHRPAFLPVPKTALRLALGETSEILTASQRLLLREAKRSSYTFKQPELAGARAAALTGAARSEAA